MTTFAAPIDAYVLPSGKLRAFTDLGCYPIFYLCADGGTLCAACATEDGQTDDKHDPQWHLVAADVHWEGEPLQCNHCNTEIQPAYPEESSREQAEG